MKNENKKYQRSEARARCFSVPETVWQVTKCSKNCLVYITLRTFVTHTCKSYTERGYVLLSGFDECILRKNNNMHNYYAIMIYEILLNIFCSKSATYPYIDLYGSVWWLNNDFLKR